MSVRTSFRANPVGADKIAHNRKPSLNKTDAKRRLFLEQYPPA